MQHILNIRVEMNNLISLCQLENRYFFTISKGMNISLCLGGGLTYNRILTNIFKRINPRTPIHLLGNIYNLLRKFSIISRKCTVKSFDEKAAFYHIYFFNAPFSE